MLNCYGDEYLPAGSFGHGAEIASVRVDELDKKALDLARELKHKNHAIVFDLGCGAGSMALRFHNLGLTAYAFDINPLDSLKKLSALQKFPQKCIIEGDITKHKWSDFPHPDIIFSQRTLHYLPYSLVVNILTELLYPLNQCWLFLSFSGLHSELGVGYPKVAIMDRFLPLSDKIANKHGILHPVCLYEVSDLNTLAKDLQLQLKEVWQSDFGNVKAILKK